MLCKRTSDIKKSMYAAYVYLALIEGGCQANKTLEAAFLLTMNKLSFFCGEGKRLLDIKQVLR